MTEAWLGDRGASVPFLAVLAIALLTVGWAGCLGSKAPQEPSQVEREGLNRTSLPWGLSGCSVVVAIVPVQTQALTEHLPVQFHPVSAQEAFGLPPDPRGDAALGVETFACQQGAGLEGPVEGLAYGALFAPVDVRANITHPSTDLDFYKWTTLVPDDPRRRALQRAGLEAVDGSTDLSGLETTPTGHSFDVSLTLNGSTFGFAGATDQPNEAFREGIPFVEFQAAEPKMALWVTLENSASDATSGTGLLQLPQGHWTSEVVGATSTQAYMVASTDVTFEQARIEVPR